MAKDHFKTPPVSRMPPSKTQKYSQTSKLVGVPANVLGAIKFHPEGLHVWIFLDSRFPDPRFPDFQIPRIPDFQAPSAPSNELSDGSQLHPSPNASTGCNDACSFLHATSRLQDHLSQQAAIHAEADAGSVFVFQSSIIALLAKMNFYVYLPYVWSTGNPAMGAIGTPTSYYNLCLLLQL